MSVFDEFATVREAVLRHLPRPAVGGAVSVSSHHVTLAEPGVSLSDLKQLLEDLGAPTNTVPAEVPLDGLRLISLHLERAAITNEISLDFTIGFKKDTPLEIAPQIVLDLAEMVFTWKNKRFAATSHVDLHIHNYLVSARVDLPAQYVTALIEGPTAHDLLKDRGISSQQAVLKTVMFSAHIPLRRALLYVELENLFSIGSVHLSQVSGQVALAESMEDVSGDVHAQVTVDMDNHSALSINVDAQMDAHGWKLAGAIDFAEDRAPVFQNLLIATSQGLGAPNPSLPGSLGSLALRHLDVSMDTHSGTFKMDANLAWPEGADLTVRLENQGQRLQLSGELHVGTTILKLIFDKATNSLMAADWHAQGGQGLDLADLLTAMKLDSSHIPSGGAMLSVSSLGMAFDASGNALIAAEIDAGIDLSRLGDLPLLGALMPKTGRFGLKLDPYYLSSGLDRSATQQARGLLSSTNFPKTLTKGFHPVVELSLGGEPELLQVTPSDPGLPAPPAIAAPLPASSKALSWTDFDKHLGPIHIKRAGHSLDKSGGGSLLLALDGDLSIAGLTLSLDGLGAGYEFDTKSLTPHLAGMGLDIKRGKLDVGGAFLNMDGDFSGALNIAMESFALHAMGQFKMLNGTPSIFAFGSLDVPLGGPVFFFVEGLAAGLGIHRDMHMPGIDNVPSFPLVAAAASVAAGDAIDSDPMTQLELLHKYVQPRLGQYFIAAGIKFNSFRLLHGNLVAVVQFGRRFEIDLLGLGSFSTPPDLPAGVPALAKVSVALDVRFVPAEGILEVDGRIDKRSYVYSPLCHLSGGVAFRSWMSGQYAGDFVLSIGGYNRHWKNKPAHYPHVPRMELKYQVDPHIYIKGDAYFALTPSTVMAGGGLHVNVKKGKLHAWTDLTVDFELGWEPFHYAAWMHLGIGAEYGWFSTHASVDLHIWGPKFSGEGEVEWTVFSFDVEFGPRRANYPKPISAAKFKASFLGIDKNNPASKMLGLNVSKGQKGQIDSMSVIDPEGAEVALSTRIPATTTVLGNAETQHGLSGLGIPPMAKTELAESRLIVTVVKDGVDISHEFELIPEQTGFPAALWSEPVANGLFPFLPSTKTDKEAGPIKAINGMRLRHKAVPTAGGSVVKQVKDFAYPEAVPQVSRIAFEPDFVPRANADQLVEELALMGLDMTDLTLPDVQQPLA